MNEKLVAVVTGANGFVGSHLVDFLLEKKIEVRCVIRKSSNLRWLEGKDVQIFDCGLFDKKGLAEAFKNADYIFHVAGVVKAKNQEGYFKGNVESTNNLLEVIIENNFSVKRFVIVSSQTVTGPTLNNTPVTEESECNPLTTYGRSKLEQEKLVLSYSKKIPVTICRAPAVFGERDTEIFIYFQTFSKGLTTLIGFDEKVLSLVHVTDLVEGLYLAAVQEISVGKTYFIGSEKYYNWDEVGKITSAVLKKNALRLRIPHFVVYNIAAFAQFFAMFSSKPATLNLEKAKDLIQHAWTCDTSKAVNELGYRQKISIQEGVRRTCDWYKDMGWI